VPALAVAEALRAEGASVAFIGSDRAEAQLVPAAGFPLHRISVEGMSRSSPLRAGRALARAVSAIPRARRLLKELDPGAVMGGGGYVAGPVGLAALSLRIPLILTEADMRPGLTTRLLAPFARRVCLAFPLSLESGRKASAVSRWRWRRRARGGGMRGGDGRYRVTGRPVPASATDHGVARERFGIGSVETCVLVFGGSLGARSLNLAAVEAFTGNAFRVLHVCGRRDHPWLAERELPAGYDLRGYLDLAEFADALAAADLVVARAGGSVFEIAAHGRPAILVPYPHASGDHQSANARWMSDAGAAITIPDSELTGPRLAREVASLLGNRGRLAAMTTASRRLARPHAATEVARELLAAAG
jgi:UDP-N-acetylglucosamine--N-acetylmuramyl-(pentapeptide) pyrophosphoryl-undecaprenol N-acetylglucosamine transferase